MADTVSREVRSRMMAGIRGKDTRPELLLRRALHARGLRYRVNVRSLPGSPDLVFPKYRCVIFVHGCFWHRHPGCRLATEPSTRPEFWQRKFAENVARDRRSLEALRAAGWRTAVVWACAIGEQPEEGMMEEVVEFVRKGVEKGEWPQSRGLLGACCPSPFSKS